MKIENAGGMSAFFLYFANAKNKLFYSLFFFDKNLTFSAKRILYVYEQNLNKPDFARIIFIFIFY